MTRAREGITTGIAALLSLTDAVPAAIVVLAGGEIVGFNRASEVLYGYERAAAIGQDFVDLLFDPDDRAGMRARLEAMVGLEAEANWRIRRADGALLVSSFRLVPIDEHHLAWIATDPLDQGLAEQERAVLLSAEHAARAEAEAAHGRLSVLASAGSAMTSTMEVGELLSRVTNVLTPTVGDWCIIELIDDRGAATHVSVGSRDRELAERAEALIGRRPLDHRTDDPVAKVVRTGQPRLFVDAESVERALRAAARDADAAEAFSTARIRSALIVPIEARGTVRGTLSLAATDQTLTDEDLDLALEVAHRLALVLTNVEAFAHERALSETLQRALLPELGPVAGIDVAARYLAATDGAEVGGDWYDVIPTGTDSVDFVIGDVAGHDLHAATGMSQLRNTIRAYACLEGATPSGSLERLDRVISNFGLDTATCIVASLDRRTGRLDWSNAGHPPPVLVHDGIATLLDQPHDWLLGVNLYDRRRHTASTTLPVGASLVLYTDGAVERRDADLGEGFEHLRQAIQAAAPGRDADGICDAVVEAMLPTGRSRPDDVAILVVRRTGPEDAS